MIYIPKKQGLIPVVNVTIGIFDCLTEKLLDKQEVHNLAVLSGRNLLRDFLGGDVVTGLNCFAVGTDDTSPVAGDTTLGTEVFRDTSFTQLTETDGNLNVKYYLASGSANGNTLVEAGLFGNGATGVPDSGTLYARVIFNQIVKTVAIAVTFSWDCGFTV